MMASKMATKMVLLTVYITTSILCRENCYPPSSTTLNEKVGILNDLFTYYHVRWVDRIQTRTEHYLLNLVLGKLASMRIACA